MQCVTKEINSLTIGSSADFAIPFASLCQNCLHALPFPADSLCFFDIETTGLSPAVSSLYLLGVLVWKKNKLMLHQWFADDYTSEKDLLIAFSEFVSGKKTFVHYNGSTFDVPYLQKKYHTHHLPSPFEGKEQIDLYKKTKFLMSCFKLPNRKLTSVEAALGFHRHDQYSGKDCISLYTSFMHKKFFYDKEAESIRNKLLLHNEEDLIGTFLCSQFFLYPNPNIKNSQFTLSDKEISFTAQLDGYYPIPLTLQREDGYLSLKESDIVLKVPFQTGVLYHFFSDYKNYFYLPKEDMAVHKSVGIYVEPAFRKKATAATCYIKKEGEFLPLPLTLDPATLEPYSSLLFRQNRKSKVYYLPLSECPKVLGALHLDDFIAHYIYERITAPSPA